MFIESQYIMALLNASRGWTEAMQLMKEGAKWELYIPSELGYGDRGAGASIPGGAVLIFTLELLKVRIKLLVDIMEDQVLWGNIWLLTQQVCFAFTF